MRVSALWFLAVTVLIASGKCTLVNAQQPKTAAEANDETARSTKSAASAILRVTADPETGLTGRGFMENLVNSGETKRKVLEAVLPDDDEIDEKLGSWLLNPLRGPDDIRVGEDQPPGVFAERILAVSREERVPAEKLLEALRDVIEKKLIELLFPERRRLNQILAMQRDMYVKLENEVRLRRTQYQNLAERLGATSSEELAAQRRLLVEAEVQRQSRLETERQSTVIELESLRARRQMLERQIAELSKQAEEGAAEDMVVKELEKAVEMQEALVAAARLQPDSDRLTAELKLAEARAELAKYRRLAQREAGGDRIAELQRRLSETDLEIVEAEVRIQALGKLSQHIMREMEKRLRADSTDLKILEMDIELQERALREAKEELHKLQRQLELFRSPMVMLIPL